MKFWKPLTNQKGTLAETFWLKPGLEVSNGKHISRHKFHILVLIFNILNGLVKIVFVAILSKGSFPFLRSTRTTGFICKFHHDIINGKSGLPEIPFVNFYENNLNRKNTVALPKFSPSLLDPHHSVIHFRSL